MAKTVGREEEEVLAAYLVRHGLKRSTQREVILEAFLKAGRHVDTVAEYIPVLDDHIAKVSVIGVGMKNHSGVASLMFNALSRENINIIMISTSEIRISCIIEEKYTELAVRALHEAFALDKEDLQ